MFEYLSQEQLERIQPKLALLDEVELSNLVALFDYDLTMAKKDNPRNFDDAPLQPEQYYFLREFAGAVGSVIVQTARGEAGTLGYLQQSDHVEKFGPLQNVWLASNSGHLWKGNIASDAGSVVIPIPGYDNSPVPAEEVINGIHFLVNGIGQECEKSAEKFPLLIKSDREMCGAVIFQIDGDKESENVADFNATVKRLIRELPEDISSLIELSPKADLVVLPDGRVQVRGYIDFKPRGMDKGFTTKIILSDMGLLTPDTVLVVAGDSKSDYPMMQIANQLAEQGIIKAAICIDVGGQIPDTDNIVDVALTGKDQSQAIDKFYSFLKDVKDGCSPSRDNDQPLRRTPATVCAQ